MRFLAVDLLAYGAFTSRRLDLSRGDQGLHLVYGRNEAGKSTTLRALRALLYGIEERTPDNFVHEYARLRIGAEVVLADGETLRFVRRKGSKNTLLDPADQPLDESLMQRVTGGVDEATFRTLFGLDHETLRAGGADILAGRGDVGQSLFAASLGHGNLRAVLDRLDEEAGEIFRLRGKNQRLNRALSEYQEAVRGIRANELKADEWREHDRALRDARQRAEALQEQIRAAQRDRSRLERLRVTLPRLVARAALRARIEAAADRVVLPASFSQERAASERQVASALAQRESAERAIVALDHQQAQLIVPDELIAAATQIERLFQRIERVEGEEERLGALRRELETQQGEVRARCAQLMVDPTSDLEALRPPVRLEAHLRELGQRRGAVEQAARKAAEDVDALERRIGQREVELGAAAQIVDARPLHDALEAAGREGDLDERVEASGRKRRTIEEQAALGVRRLGWTGTLDALAGLPLPSLETVDRFERELAAAQRDLNDAERQRDETAEALADLDRQIEQQRLLGEVPTEQELIEGRTVRDQTWRGFRADARPLTDRDALDAYERQVAHADTVADRLRREASRVERYASLRAERGRIELRCRAARETAQVKARIAADLSEQWAACWAPSGLAPRAPQEMRSWLQQHAKLSDLAAQLGVEQAEHERLQALRARRSEELREALETTGAGPPPGASGWTRVHSTARERLRELDERALTRRNIETELRRERGELGALLARRDEAAQRWSRWREEWAEAVAALRLDAGVTPDEASSTLKCIERLLAARDRAAELRREIDGVVEVARRFEAEARELAGRLDPTSAALPPGLAIRQLHAQLQTARLNAARVAQIAQQRDTQARAITDAEVTIAEHQRRLEALCRQAGVAEAHELPLVEERSRELDAWRNELEDKERQLVELGQGLTLQQLAEEAENARPDDLVGELGQLHERVERLTHEREACLQEIAVEGAWLRDRDGVSTSAQQAELAQAKLAEIRAYAERYARVRLASEILKREVERFRERNQGPLLQRASELFAQLTLGSFSRLQVSYDDKDEPRLLGLRANGPGLGVEGMSDGTRDQLYLALRLASLERFIAHREPLPFVVDDILVHFDDPRSEATLSVLGELSRRTQVLFFTHHQRLVELAARALPAEVLVVHELG